MMDEHHVLLKGHHMLLEAPNTYDDRIYTGNTSYNSFEDLFLEQLHSRSLLFDKLLAEFSKLIDFSDKKVIQQTAAVQALCSDHLTTDSKKKY
mmetsp:Transcript_53555/g.80046  ORF Transcript_53555/g.80046 Transcript_53555/m.80046 type:complete len:93 (-) Transcript_53555:45-323(-)